MACSAWSMYVRSVALREIVGDQDGFNLSEMDHYVTFETLERSH